MHATIPKGSLGHEKYSFYDTEPTMPRSYNEDLGFRAMWMKEFLGAGYTTDFAAAILHMSSKTIQHCVLK